MQRGEELALNPLPVTATYLHRLTLYNVRKKRSDSTDSAVKDEGFHPNLPPQSPFSSQTRPRHFAQKQNSSKVHFAEFVFSYLLFYFLIEGTDPAGLAGGTRNELGSPHSRHEKVPFSFPRRTSGLPSLHLGRKRRPGCREAEKSPGTESDAGLALEVEAKRT